MLLATMNSVVYASQPNSFDLALKELDAVDSKYKYQDFEKASEYFRVLTTKLSYSYPVKIDAIKSIESMYMTPYTGYVNYRFLLDFNEEMKEQYQNEITLPESYKNWCQVFYIAKFMPANNYKFIIEFKDINYDTVGLVKIDSKTCK